MIPSDDFKESVPVKPIINLSQPIPPGKKTVIQCFTGSGLVAGIAGNVVRYTFDLEEVGTIEGEAIPAIAVVRHGLIQNPLRIYADDEMILFICDVALPSTVLPSIIKSLFDWYVANNAERIYLLAGLPTRKSTSKDSPKLFVAANVPEACDEAEEKGLETLDKGVVYGSVALSLLEGRKRGIPVIALMAESVPNMADYDAASKVISGLSKLIGKKIPLSSIDFAVDPAIDLPSAEEEFFDLDDEDETDDDYFDPSELK